MNELTRDPMNVVLHLILLAVVLGQLAMIAWLLFSKPKAKSPKAPVVKLTPKPADDLTPVAGRVFERNMYERGVRAVS